MKPEQRGKAPVSASAKTVASDRQEELSRIGLFEGLDKAQLKQVGAHLHARDFPAGAVFIHQNQTAGGLFFLREGLVKVFLPHDEQVIGGAREVVIATCGPGQTLGEIDLADGKGHTASVAALETSRLWWMAGDDFWRCHGAMPSLSRNLCRLLAQRMRQSTVAHDVLTALPLPGKIAFHLLSLARDGGSVQPDGSILLSLPLNQSEMATLAGSSRERVNRTLAQLQKQDYLQMHSDAVLLRNVAALRRMCRDLSAVADDWHD